MKWAEQIMLRTAGRPVQPIQKLFDQIVGSVAEQGLVKISLYKHATFPGDFAITLLWDTEETRPWGSELALGLKQELKKQGLLDHSVWIPVETAERGSADESNVRKMK